MLSIMLRVFKFPTAPDDRAYQLNIYAYFCPLISVLMANIAYFSEQVSFTLRNKRLVSAWIRATILAEGFVLDQLNLVFCSDAYLLQINRDYLQHDYLTDIITFDQSEDSEYIEGDIFISIDRVRENAKLYAVAFLHELHRVIIHGVLHLCGYDDYTNTDRKAMKEKEDFYLSMSNPSD
jgi:probable rRNA maturation factor